MEYKHKVTLYAAAPGTPLKSGKASAAGHVYYQLEHGEKRESYGFTPVKDGDASGPGTVKYSDADDYLNPHYQRTIEITEEQYSKLKAFGNAPADHGFDMKYNGFTNSCVDFMWGALNHAGLHRTTEAAGPDIDFDGAIKPLENIEHIRSIPAPFPDSELNEEPPTKPLPEQTRLQKLFSEEDLPTKDRDMLNGIRKQVASIDREHNREYDDTSERLAVGLLAAAKERQLDRVDHVVLGNPPPDGSGRRMFAVQGALDNPAHVRTSIEINEAASLPVEQTYERLAKVEQEQHRQTAAQTDRSQQRSEVQIA